MAVQHLLREVGRRRCLFALLYPALTGPMALLLAVTVLVVVGLTITCVRRNGLGLGLAWPPERLSPQPLPWPCLRFSF
jgi:hypothetical protein